MKLTSPQREMTAQTVLALAFHLMQKDLFSERVIKTSVEYFVSYMATNKIVRAHAVNADAVSDAFDAALIAEGFDFDDETNEREAFRSAIRALTKVYIRPEPIFSDL